MDFLVSTIISGFIWDIMKGTGTKLAETLRQLLPPNTDYETCEKIATKITELGDIKKYTYESFSEAIQKNEPLIELINTEIHYPTNFAMRMDYLISLTNVYSNKEINLELIAEYLEFQSVNELKQYYTKTEEPSFPFISEVADKLGVNAEWLKNGNGTPFYSKYSFDRATEYYDITMNDNPKYIIFCLSEQSHMGIITKHNSYKYTYCRKTWHFNSNVGATGESQIISIYQFIKKLYDDNNTMLFSCKVLYLNNDMFSKLFNGEIPTCAVEFIGKPKYSPYSWLEDFIELQEANEYGKDFTYCQNVVRCFLKDSETDN